MVVNTWDSYLLKSIDDLKASRLLRELRPTVAGPSCAEAVKCDESHASVKLFSLNDYLGLSTHPSVCAAAAEAAQSLGNGPRSSALVGGFTTLHRDLEQSLAQLCGTEEALLFPSGFSANLSVMAAVAGSPDVEVFSDELNHASLVDGLRLAKGSGASVHVYRHNDMNHLAQLLEQSPSKPTVRRLVVTDSLFSMDGDYAPLEELARLKRRHGFLLAVDEAHATLVCGERGAGAAEMAGVEDSVDLHLGTLSKAVGSFGGFLACSAAWKSFLVTKARGQVFSTALPLPAVAGALAGIRVAREEPEHRALLWEHTRTLGAALGMVPQSPIFPLIVGTEERALTAGQELWVRGFHVPAIRPPTVPRGTSRLRISLSAAHTRRDVQDLIEALSSMGLTDKSVPMNSRL